jgi:hypothetical protein
MVIWDKLLIFLSVICVLKITLLFSPYVSNIPTGNHRRNVYILPMDELEGRIITKIVAYIRAFFFNIYVEELECPPLEYLHVRHREHEGTGMRQVTPHIHK